MSKFLYCHTDLVMDDGNIEAVKGKKYYIKGDYLSIIDESGNHHSFDFRKDDPGYYKHWFYLYTEEEFRESKLKELLNK